MVVHYLDIKSIFTIPPETDSELVVNPDAVLILPVSLERLKSIPPKFVEILQTGSCSNSSQFDSGFLMQLHWQQLSRLLRRYPVVYLLRGLVFKAPDCHYSHYTG
jgi:hypothetical protein